MHSAIKNLAVPVWFCLYLSACSSESAPADAPEGAGAMPPPAVDVVTMQSKAVTLDLQYPGRATGSQEIEVRARVDGILLRRNYQEGTYVEAGSVLFEIDPQPFKVELARANARLQQAEAQLLVARRDWERAEQVFARGAISASDHDTRQSAFELAEAGVALARAEVQAAEINLGYTTVTAPISGITSREALSEGSLVGPTQGMSLLTRIVKTDPLYVVFAIPESEYTNLRQLRPAGSEDAPLSAELLWSDGTVGMTEGTVDFTASTIDATTGTVQARAVFPNPGNAVLPGTFVRVKLTGLSLNDALLVPQAAVLQGPQGTFVFTVDQQNLVQYTPVTTGVAVGSNWLVTSGLETGMRVISNGLLKVQPGSPVTVSEAAPAPAAE